MKSNDGEAACELLTEEGKRIAVKVFEGQGNPSFPDPESLEASDCQRAVDGASISSMTLPTVDADDISVSEDHSSAVAVFPDSNELLLTSAGGGWLLVTPIPSGR